MARVHGQKRHVVTLGLMLIGMLLAGCPYVFALNPALDASQSPHTAWKAGSGPKVKAPPGSYQLSCVMVDMRGTNLRATCRTIKGDWLTTELHDPARCGDIENINGHLTCQSPLAAKDRQPKEKTFEDSASGIEELLS